MLKTFPCMANSIQKIYILFGINCMSQQGSLDLRTHKSQSLKLNTEEWIILYPCFVPLT